MKEVAGAADAFFPAAAIGLKVRYMIFFSLFYHLFHEPQSLMRCLMGLQQVLLEYSMAQRAMRKILCVQILYWILMTADGCSTGGRERAAQ